MISIHTPLAGSDAMWFKVDDSFFSFQSTLPLRGATAGQPAQRRYHRISIHTPLAGSDLRGLDLPSGLPISIHTPLAGSDAWLAAP